MVRLDELTGSYLPLISHIRKMLSRARKKSYTISVGKLNPEKLANFMEIECFVIVACPENSVVEAKVSQSGYYFSNSAY
jgi:diphthamide biosynthesis protein 2